MGVPSPEKILFRGKYRVISGSCLCPTPRFTLSSIADYNTVANYIPEAGKTNAHTYNWNHTLSRLGHMVMGTGAPTSAYPAALAFANNGLISCLVNNFIGQVLMVTFSDGHIVNTAP